MMSKLLVILFFIVTNSYGQKDSVKWITQDEKLISGYDIQQSIRDSFHWDTYKTGIFKGKSLYVYKIPTKTAYYRIKARGKNSNPNYYTNAKYLNIGNNVTISNPTKTLSSLSFKTTNESNVDYYLIQKSSDGKTYTQTTKIPATGDATYTYRISKTVKQYTYIVTVVYKDSVLSKPIKFR